MSTENKETKTVVANGRTYVFQIIDAIHGVGLFHQYASILVENSEDVIHAVKAFISTQFDDEEGISPEEIWNELLLGDSAILRIVKLISKVVSLPRLFELSSDFLSGAKIDDDICDEKGMCVTFRKNPIELYTAIVHAVFANYEDMLPFPSEDEEDTKESN